MINKAARGGVMQEMRRTELDVDGVEMSLVQRLPNVGVRVGALRRRGDVVLPAKRKHDRIKPETRRKRKRTTHLSLVVTSISVLFLDAVEPLFLRFIIRCRARRDLVLVLSEVSSPALERMRLTNAA